MRKLQRSVLAGAFLLALAASGTAAAQFSNVFYFGDSLTDAGSFKPVLPPGTGLFTTNPGPVWAQVFGANYGFTVTPANQGGTDYAQGGARVTSLPGVPTSAPTGTAVPIATQISQFLAKGRPIQRVLLGLGRRQRFLLQLGLAASAATPAQRRAGIGPLRSSSAQAIRTARRGARSSRRQRPGHRHTPFGVGSGQGPDHRALVVLQHHAVRRSMPRASRRCASMRSRC